MGAHEHVDTRVAPVVTLPTLAEIDALPDVEDRLEEVHDAISFVSVADRQRLVTELLADLDDDRAMSVMIPRFCSLPVECVGQAAKELRELLERTVVLRKRIADNERNPYAREKQRAAEVALIVALGPHAQNSQAAE